MQSLQMGFCIEKAEGPKDPLNQVLQPYKKYFVYSVNLQPELCIFIRFSRSARNLVVIWSDLNWFSAFHSACCG